MKPYGPRHWPEYCPRAHTRLRRPLCSWSASLAHILFRGATFKQHFQLIRRYFDTQRTMQASGTVDGDVGMSFLLFSPPFFCKHLLSSRTCDGDVAVHIKEHHIIHTHTHTHARYHPEGAENGRLTNRTGDGMFFSHSLFSFESQPPLFLRPGASAAPPLCPNCMAWPKPIKIALLERVERGVRETTTNIDFLFFGCCFLLFVFCLFVFFT